MQYLGDYTEDYATLNFKFSTHKADGTPATLSGTPAISVYKANSTTQSTAGITLTVDFDGVTGLNNVLIDLSADAFYATANDYSVVITTGTVDSVSVVGTVLAHFSIENRTQKADLVKLGGNTQSATDLKDLVDTGYDPSTHKIQGTVLVDGVTGMATSAELAKVPKSDSNVSLNSTVLAAIADAVLDEVVEGTTTLRQKLRLDLSALTGLMAVVDNGDGTHTYTFRDIGNTKDRIVVVVNDSTKDRDTITTRDGA